MIKTILIKLIRIYQILISPILPASCRFHPTCSNYFIDALKEYGVIIGVWLGVKRIFRCNPFSKGGYDPVPPKTLKIE